MAKTKKKTRNTLNYETLPALFTGICDAIRTKAGTSGLIDHQDIPAEILAIPTGGGTIVALNEVFTVAAYGGDTKSYTATEAGTINIVALASGTGPNQLGITKNGSGVSEYVSFANAGSNSMMRSASISVAVDDVIAVNISTASVTATCMALAILTPTT